MTTERTVAMPKLMSPPSLGQPWPAVARLYWPYSARILYPEDGIRSHRRLSSNRWLSRKVSGHGNRSAERQSPARSTGRKPDPMRLSYVLPVRILDAGDYSAIL